MRRKWVRWAAAAAATVAGLGTAVLLSSTSAFGDTVSGTTGDISYSVTWTQGPGTNGTTLLVQNTAAPGGHTISDFTFNINGGPAITAVSGGACRTTDFGNAPLPAGEIECGDALSPGQSETITITTQNAVATGTNGTITFNDDAEASQPPVTVGLQGSGGTTSTTTTTTGTASTGGTTSTTEPTTTATEPGTTGTGPPPPATNPRLDAIYKTIDTGITEMLANAGRKVTSTGRAKAAAPVIAAMATSVADQKEALVRSSTGFAGVFAHADTLDVQLAQAQFDADQAKGAKSGQAKKLWESEVKAQLKGAVQTMDRLEGDLGSQPGNRKGLKELKREINQLYQAALNDSPATVSSGVAGVSRAKDSLVSEAINDASEWPSLFNVDVDLALANKWAQAGNFAKAHKSADSARAIISGLMK